MAEKFGKQHKNVLRAIEAIIYTLESNNLPRLNFEPCSRTYNGREFPMYEMDRNAFSQLVGSFTGEKATVFRKKYADAFDAMEEHIKRQQEPKQIGQREILALAETVIFQNKEIEILLPKAEVYDSVMST